MPEYRTAKFVANPLEVARRHSLLVDASPVNFTGNGMGERIQWAPGIPHVAGNHRHTLTRAETRCKAQFVKNTVRNNSTHKGYVLRVSPLADDAEIDPATEIPIWFLSWNPYGGQVDMRLSTRAYQAQSGVNTTPRFFFTTKLNGCSVFARGSRLRPQIFHSGAEGKPFPGNSAEHWRGLYQAHRPQGGAFAEVSYQSYMGPDMPQHDAPTTRFTAPIQHYLDTVLVPQLMSGEPVQLRGIVGQGCVFGIKGDDQTWRIYLQENAHIIYSRFPNPLDVLYLNRPLRVRQIWPHTADAPLDNPELKGLP